MLTEVSNENNSNFKKPNVIIIMSEAFADFRRFSQLDIDQSIYEALIEFVTRAFHHMLLFQHSSIYSKSKFELNLVFLLSL